MGTYLRPNEKGIPPLRALSDQEDCRKVGAVRSGRTARGLGDPFHLSHLDKWPRSGETRRDTAAPRRSAYLAATGPAMAVSRT